MVISIVCSSRIVWSPFQKRFFLRLCLIQLKGISRLKHCNIQIMLSQPSEPSVLVFIRSCNRQDLSLILLLDTALENSLLSGLLKFSVMRITFSSLKLEARPWQPQISQVLIREQCWRWTKKLIKSKRLLIVFLKLLLPISIPIANWY